MPSVSSASVRPSARMRVSDAASCVSTSGRLLPGSETTTTGSRKPVLTKSLDALGTASHMPDLAYLPIHYQFRHQSRGGLANLPVPSLRPCCRGFASSVVVVLSVRTRRTRSELG